MPCSEKACPFPPSEGEVLCRYHRQSYAFEISMRDDALDLRAVSFDDPKGGTVEGLTIVHRKRDTRTFDEKATGLYHQILASGRMVKRALSAIEAANPATVADWTTNVFAAQELFQHARYDGSPVCCICGAQDYWDIVYGVQHRWKCKRCRYSFSVNRQTIMQHSLLRLDQWASALITTARAENRSMVIRDIQRNAGCTYTTAWRLNYKVRIAGLTVGLDLGFRGQVNNVLWNTVAMKSGVSLRELKV